MNHSFPRSSALALVLGGGLLGACAAPTAQHLARDPVTLVEERLGAAPLWRRGEALSPQQEMRVRELLSMPLDEHAAVEVALLRNRRLQALIEHAIAEATTAHAEAVPSNPVLDLLVRWPHGSGGPIVDVNLAFGLLDFVRLPGRRDAAAQAARGSALEAADAIVHAVADVRTAWIDAVASRERETLDAAIAEAASIAGDLADRQHAAGTLAQFDVLRLRAFADEAFAELGRARTQSRRAAERLVRALGVFGDEASLTVAESLPAPPAEMPEPGEVERRAVARRIDLERARVAVIQARLAAGLATDERMLPGAGAGVSFERDTDGGRSSGPGLSLVLPLSPRDAARAEAAEAAVREAEDRLHDLAVRVRSEAREAAAVLGGASAVAARYRDAIVPRRAAMVEEAQLRYNGMLVGVYDLLSEKREELRARRDLVDAVRDAWFARIELDLALGGEPLPPGDARPAATVPESAAPAETPHHHGGH